MARQAVSAVASDDAPNPLLEWFEHQRERFGRTYEYWAKRWGINNSATVARWAKGDRRIGPRNRHVFADLPFSMDEYYALTPPSDKTQKRSNVRRFGRTRAKAAAGRVATGNGSKAPHTRRAAARRGNGNGRTKRAAVTR